jgi:hypothetical protein
MMTAQTLLRFTWAQQVIQRLMPLLMVMSIPHVNTMVKHTTTFGTDSLLGVTGYLLFQRVDW